MLLHSTLDISVDTEVVEIVAELFPSIVVSHFNLFFSVSKRHEGLCVVVPQSLLAHTQGAREGIFQEILR